MRTGLTRFKAGCDDLLANIKAHSWIAPAIMAIFVAALAPLWLSSPDKTTWIITFLILILAALSILLIYARQGLIGSAFITLALCAVIGNSIALDASPQTNPPDIAIQTPGLSNRPSPTASALAPQDPDPQDEEPLASKAVRIEGNDRFQTSAALARTWEEGVETVYIASANNYLDSLPAAALAASNGDPLLLTGNHRLHSVTSSAIKYLKPREIVIVGGESAIGSEVENELRDIASGNVRRTGGLNRFATASLLTEEHDEIDSVYIVTDTTYPDALASAAQAGASRGPILLATPHHVPVVTWQAINNLRYKSFVIVGGVEALPADLEEQLRELDIDATRISGTDRYETAVLLSQRSDRQHAPLVVASGAAFSDALSAAPLAAKEGGTVLLTNPELLPTVTLREANRLEPNRIIIVGSPDAINGSVEGELSGLLQ